MKELSKKEFDYLKYVLDNEYGVVLKVKGNLFFVYTKDDRLIFLTSNPVNIITGLKVLYGKEAK